MSAKFAGATEQEILDRIESGETITTIAKDLGRNRATLSLWLSGDSERATRARAARERAAQAWDEMAEQGIRDAKTKFALAKAREVAHHYRWRASKIAPKEYGDKVSMEHSGAVELVSMLSEARKRAGLDP